MCALVDACVYTHGLYKGLEGQRLLTAFPYEGSSVRNEAFISEGQCCAVTNGGCRLSGLESQPWCLLAG